MQNKCDYSIIINKHNYPYIKLREDKEIVLDNQYWESLVSVATEALSNEGNEQGAYVTRNSKIQARFLYHDNLTTNIDHYNLVFLLDYNSYRSIEPERENLCETIQTTILRVHHDDQIVIDRVFIESTIDHRFSALINAMENATKAMQPYKEVAALLSQRLPQFQSSTFNEQIHAIANCSLSDHLASSVSKVLAPYYGLMDTIETMSALGNSIQPLIKHEVYSSIPSLLDRIPDYRLDVSRIVSTLEPITHTASLISTSWLNMENNWLVNKDILASIDYSSIFDMSGTFASLCRLEQQTSKISNVPNSIVSVASQITSIVEAIKPTILVEDLWNSGQLLSDYCNMAAKQHRMLQKATDQIEIKWRLDVLDAASKYVDRQFAWVLGLSDRLSEKSIIKKDDHEENELYASAISLIPVHIGYTRRSDIKKSPADGLLQSSLVSITEKGKRISNSIIKINELQLDNGKDRVFGLSEKLVKSTIHFGTVICNDDNQLSSLVDDLYFVFYENIEHIKIIVGKGNKKLGDQLVREEEVYQCIFRVKAIRSDYRHDLDHGADSDRKKKQKEIGDCYKHYCGHRPLKEREFRTIQEKLYEEFILLIDTLISLQVSS